MILPELVLESGLMKLRILIWTLGLGFVGYALGGRGGPNPAHETVGAILGAAIGCCVGWGLQRLLEMGRRR
jgi:uncharacterized membrane protein